MDRYDKGAAEILAHIAAVYVPTHRYVPVRPADFRHLDLKFYESTLAELRTKGFTHLADVEDLTIAAAPGNVMKRVMIRSMVSADRTIIASAYDPKLKFGWWLLFSILRKAPAPILDFETEFADGAFIVTSNAEIASAMTSPPLILTEYFKKKTPAAALLARHAERVRAYSETTGARANVVGSHGDLVLAQNRMNAIKAAFRDQVGGISTEELERAVARLARHLETSTGEGRRAQSEVGLTRPQMDPEIET
jgi:hypothetical protein